MPTSKPASRTALAVSRAAMEIASWRTMTEARIVIRGRFAPSSLTRLFRGGSKLGAGRAGTVRRGRAAEKCRDVARHALGREVRLIATPAGRSQALAQGGILDQALKGALQRGGVAGLREKAGLTPRHDFRHAARAAADHRLREHHSLQQDQSEGLEPGRRYENIAGAIKATHRFL